MSAPPLTLIGRLNPLAWLRGARRYGIGSSRLLVIGIVIVSIAILTAIFGPLLAPYDPVAVSLRDRLVPPSPEHLLGTDQLGRDIFSRILHAGRVTISIALVAMVVSAGIGISVGIVSGYFGGRVDMITQRIVDIQLAFPTILLAITVVAVLGSSVPILIAVFVFAGWARYVRVIRAQTLVVRETQYVEAARAMGATRRHILLRYVAPNLLTEIIALMNLEVARIVLLESGLSYLGLGVQPPLPTWGNMLSDGRLYLTSAWWFVTFPGLAIMAVVLGMNLLAEGLRAFYDPRERRFAEATVSSSQG
ncbi:MAG TPA: ABC transporter permease [Candidatus Limnocylindria bacterium]|nr:ABC transporter permease [Candidatus Limnocylindria bacterium]